MIPFIIGGVALATTGYGLAKLLEEDCSCNKKHEPFFMNEDNKNNKAQKNKFLDKYEQIKKDLYDTSLMELKIALNEIENLDKEILIKTSIFEKVKYQSEYFTYPFEELTDEIKQSFEKYTNILQNTKEYINTKLDSLDSIIVNESNYEKYKDDDKKLVDELVCLCILIDKVSQSQMTNDKVNTSRKVKRAFSKIDKIIS